MNPQVAIESQSIKDSLKRNAIGKALITVAITVIVYYSFVSSLISCLTAIYLLVGYITLLIILDYYIAVSVIIDKSVLALFKRKKK